MHNLVYRFPFLALTILPLAVGCAGPSLSDGPAEEVFVFAAASTTNAIEEICRDFEREYNVRARLSFAATSTLAQQIINGAEAHVHAA